MPPPSSGAWRMSLRSTPDPTRSVSRRFAWRREEQAAGGRGKGATRRLPGAPSSLRLGEYERNGTANLFITSEPLAGWRHVEVTGRRTRADFAHFVRDLVDGRYRDA